MIYQMPRWIWAIAWILAFVAGIVNVTGLLGFEHQSVSHLTGNTSMLARALAERNVQNIFHFSATIGSFFLGTALSGFVIRDSTLCLGRRYGVALLLETILLWGAIPFLKQNSMWGLYAAACACGLQNAMVSTYSGTVIRTTHVSGMFTDLGIFLGHLLRGISVDSRRLRLCLLIISAFLCGGIVGTLLFQIIGYSVLVIPGAISGGLAITYMGFFPQESSSPTKRRGSL